jgi:uncharacterized protein DUF4440
MDQAWELEKEFWKESSAGTAGNFYQRHMIADGYVVIPSGVVSRDELIAKWNSHRPVRSYDLSEPHYTLLEGGSNVILTYHVKMDSEWLPQYEAHMTAVYTWEGGGWALAVRTHTPVASFTF